LVLEHPPCKVTTEFVQSLSNEIEEFKFLSQSIEWNVPLVRSFGPRLNYLALICPNNTMTIHDFVEALEGKVDRLYLCNDESSSRRLSAEDVAKLFENILNLELDGSLLTEIRPMDGSKTESLIIYLKDKVLEKDFYEKYSYPKSITKFNVRCPVAVDPSHMFKGWNDANVASSASTSPSAKDGVRQGMSDDEIKLDMQHKSQMGSGTMRSEEQAQGLLDGVAVMEDNKLMSNDVTSEQGQGTTKKMSFKEKLQSGPKVSKKASTLRIGGSQ